MSGTFCERTFVLLVDALLYPARVAPKTLTKVAGTFALALLVLAIVLLFPPMKDFLFCKIELFYETKRPEYDQIKNWCDFISITCQVVIVVTIGGLVFTDGVATWLRQRSQNLQSRIQAITDALQAGAQPTPNQQRLLDYEKEIEDLKFGITWKNFSQRYRTLSVIIDNMYEILLPDAPKMNFIFTHSIHIPFPFNLIPGFRNNKLPVLMGLRYGLAFPGGVYGGLAYLCFLAMVGATVLKTYFDYAPACS